MYYLFYPSGYDSLICVYIPNGILIYFTLESFSKVIVSGERLLAIITLGYNEAKSNAIVGIKFTPFLGLGTNAPGYF